MMRETTKWYDIFGVNKVFDSFKTINRTDFKYKKGVLKYAESEFLQT